MSRHETENSINANGGPSANSSSQRWPWVRVDELADTCSGTTPSRGRDSYFGGSIPWIKTGELRDNLIDNAEEHVTEAALQETSLKLLPKGTLLIAMYGQGQTRGRTGLLSREATINQACFAILPNAKFDPSFLQLWFQSSYGRLRAKTEFRGGNQPNLNGDVLRQELVPLPPLAEQRRIAGRLREQLAEVAKARTAVQAQLAAAQALPAAFFRAVFDSEEARQWERIPFGEICFGNGQYGTSERSTNEQRGLPVLRMGNLFDGHVLWGDLKYAALPTTELDKYRLVAGDLIFNRTNSVELVGKSAVFDGSREAIFASYLVRFRLRPDRADSHFVCAFINSQFGRAFIDANMTRAIGQANVSASTMKAMPIPMPHITVQRAIAARLTAELAEVTRLRESLSGKLETLDRLPAALLAQAFQESE